MQIQCACGTAVTTDQPPGAYVRCPNCEKPLQVPGAAFGASPGYGATPSRASVGPRTSALAITALVLGCAAVVLGPITGIPAVILGVVAIVKTRRSGGRLIGKGMAVAGLVVGLVFSALFALFIGAVTLPAVRRARQYARLAVCSDNLRQVGIALTDYAIEHDDRLPPGDRNTFAYLARYLGESNATPEGGDVFRCSAHDWLPPSNRRLYGSYVFNVSLSSAENAAHSPMSCADEGRLRRLGGTSPDTIVAIEMWMRPKPDGAFSNQLRLDDYEWSPIKAGCVPIDRYTATTAAAFDARGRLIDPGPYRFLDCYKGTNVPVSEMYHLGKINVLFADGSVSQEDLRRFTSQSPVQDKRWTRQRD